MQLIQLFYAKSFLAFVLTIVLQSLKCFGEDNPLIFSTNDCSLIEPVYGHRFDLSGLHSDIAHKAVGHKGDQFDFNICGNLSRSCDGQKNVSACLQRNNKEYVLGTQHKLNYRNGKMYFEFSGGAKCPNGSEKFSFHVFIGCDYTLDKNPTQVTTYADDACSFYITLETPLACLPEPDAVKSNKCSVRDPQNGHNYDLMPLSDFNYRTTDRSGSVFVINVCKPVLYGENAMCPPGSSVCFVSTKSVDFKKKFFDYGTAQPDPVFENGKLLMRHTSLTPCNSTTNYSSIIYFYCDKDVRNAHPEFIGAHGCVYEFSFVTPLACNDLAPCTAITSGSGIIDLSTLLNKPFQLPMDGKNYTLGICSAAGAPCLENDGACFAVNDMSTSLGTFNSHLRFDHLGSSYLLYEGGAACQSTDKFWSTKIEFICANNKKNKNDSSTDTTTIAPINQIPQIIENHNCQLLIHYPTELVCQEQISCKAKAYVDHSEDGTSVEVLDLTPLISNSENYEAQIDNHLITSKKVPKTTKFFLNVCRPLVSKFGLGCPGGSAGCMAKVDNSSSTPEEEQSLGYPIVSLVAINRTTAELRYLQGSVCPTDKDSQLSMGIQFHCDKSAGRGTPVLHTISDCYHEFSWATNVICPAHMCNFNADTCEIKNDEINVSYNLKKAPYTDAGKIKIEENKREFTFNVCGNHRKALTDYSQGLVNLYFTTDGPCKVDKKVNIQMRIICSEETAHAVFFNDDIQCNLLFVQRTPDICKFLGLNVPTKLSTTSTPSTTPVRTTTEADSSSTQLSPNENHAAEHTGDVGAILGAILSVTCFVSCLAFFAFSPQRRNAVRRLFRRSSSAVRYSRVQSNEEANLLLEPNGEFTDSDDDMLL